MKALILAAGYGTRLKEIGKDTPKALLEVADKPLLDHILTRLSSLEDLNNVLVVSNNKFYSDFESWAASRRNSTKINVINDGTNTPDDRLGSIGDIEYTLRHHAVDDDLLVVGGDNLFDFNIEEFYKFARSKDEAVTIGLYDVGDLNRAKNFGVVDVDENKRVVSFEEKPDAPRSTLVAMCFYFFPKSTLPLIGQYLGESKKADRAGDYIRWLTEKSDVFGFKFTGKWYDIGSVESYERANKDFSG